MARVARWLAARGFSMRRPLRGGNSVCFLSKTVSVSRGSGRRSEGKAVAIALHECGHVLVHQQRKRSKTKTVAGHTWKQALQAGGGGRFEGVRSRALRTYHEEFVAWERGEKLARRLGVRLARGTFERQRTRCLMSYARWLTLPLEIVRTTQDL